MVVVVGRIFCRGMAVHVDRRRESCRASRVAVVLLVVAIVGRCCVAARGGTMVAASSVLIHGARVMAVVRVAVKVHRSRRRRGSIQTWIQRMEVVCGTAAKLVILAALAAACFFLVIITFFVIVIVFLCFLLSVCISRHEMGGDGCWEIGWSTSVVRVGS